jgi:hypothetical protein
MGIRRDCTIENAAHSVAGMVLQLLGNAIAVSIASAPYNKMGQAAHPWRYTLLLLWWLVAPFFFTVWHLWDA